jgi:peptidoglycan hydrolase-like protein with peptidoglycan-binding domain
VTGRDPRERRQLRERRPVAQQRQQRERLLRTLVVAGVVASVGVFAVAAQARDTEVGSPGSVDQVAADPAAVEGVEPAGLATPGPTTTVAGGDAAATEGSQPTESTPDLAGAPTELTADCTVAPKTISNESESIDVQCLQQALQREGFYSGAISGELDFATSAAVESLQKERDLFVDGVAGRETGIELGIWPDELLLVVRTPPPPAGAMDSWGYPLSSVASTGKDAPPLPENSGEGRRVVYERISQRVWAVSDDGEIVRSWLVAGSQYNNEMPGTHYVYSRSEQSTAWNGRAILPLMIRWLQTDIGHIGFHGIPIHVSDGSPYMTEAELGTRLSGGCQRQSNRDAQFMWAFAEVGTKVVVL